ncbi:probable carboxylesterase 2 [Brachypodium distachyon]|nr:probable carboxylesterase 2 [Brachypodium distachyon]|eukprot:XP_003574617.1 probable carboxylesterase 2 [Brachypodium distachyon]
MDPDSEVTFEFVPVIRQYKSGRVERLLPTNPVPPSVDAATGVTSKDATVDPATGLWARLYLPAAGADDKLAIVVYLHGGGLVAGSAADAPEHAFLNRLCARARVLAVSVEYRLAPEHPVPACYDDAWAALRWAASAADPWIRDHGDRDRVFVVGYSAGGNIAHNVALRAAGSDRPVRIGGLGLVHPYFLSGEKGLAEGEMKHAWLRAKLEEMWAFACAGRTTGLDDPRVNPVADGAESLTRLRLACGRVLVCLAEDELWFRGKAYYDGLLGSGWAEEDAELLDSVGEDHQFFLQEPESAMALALMDRLVALFSRNQ